MIDAVTRLGGPGLYQKEIEFLFKVSKDICQKRKIFEKRWKGRKEGRRIQDLDLDLNLKLKLNLNLNLNLNRTMTGSNLSDYLLGQSY